MPKNPGAEARKKKTRFTIARKASFGYVVLLTLLFLTSAVALLSLIRINSINEDIINSDIPVINAAERLIDVLLGEELYARRYTVLRTPEIRNLFDEKGREFERILEGIREGHIPEGLPIAEVENSHNDYRRVLQDWLGTSSQRGLPGRKASDTEIREQQEKLVALVKDMAKRAREEQRRRTEEISLIGTVAFRVAATFCGIGLFIALMAALLITRNISGTIEKLKLAAGRIVQSDFDNIPKITQKDELGAVAVAFIGMAKRLRYLEDVTRKVRIQEATVEGAPASTDEEAVEEVPAVAGSSDVRQITGLPAGKAVMEGLRERIRTKQPFAYCIVRIENLKPYNERYDWGKGDTMVQAVAGIVEDAVAEARGEGDLLGHKWGAQFVILTAPDRYEQICRAIIRDFDEAAPFFYDPEDREQGYITGKAPGGATAVFPLATISIAVVTSDSPDARTSDHVQVAAGQLLEWARTQGGSTLVVDMPE